MPRWIAHNCGRVEDFRFSFHPTPFAVMDFHAAAADAAGRLAGRLAGQKLFVALSGGIDSEYVMEALHRAGLAFTPMIVATSGTKAENAYAFRRCQRLNIKPLVFEVTDQEFLAVYQRYVVDRFGCRGVNSVPSIIAGMQAERRGGILVTGDHLIEDHPLSVVRLDGNAWDYYVEVLFGAVIFFTSTPELAYAMARRMDRAPAAAFKAALYGLEQRPKLRPRYHPALIDQVRAITPAGYAPTCVIGSRDAFLRMMDEWNESAGSPADADGGGVRR